MNIRNTDTYSTILLPEKWSSWWCFDISPSNLTVYITTKIIVNTAMNDTVIPTRRWNEIIKKSKTRSSEDNKKINSDVKSEPLGNDITEYKMRSLKF